MYYPANYILDVFILRGMELHVSDKNHYVLQPTSMERRDHNGGSHLHNLGAVDFE